MNRTIFLIILVLPLFVHAQDEKHRLVVLADMGNESDEVQQMHHLLMCSNEINIEGLIAVTDKYLRESPQPGLFWELIDGYSKAYKNLLLHSNSYPSPEYLGSAEKHLIPKKAFWQLYQTIVFKFVLKTKCKGFASTKQFPMHMINIL